MKSCSILLAFCMLLCCGGQVFGQNQHGHVYEDSSILYPPEENIQPVQQERIVEEAPQEATDEEETSDEADTSLVKNRNILSGDSVNLLKNSKQFAYAKKLDSLLRDYQQKQAQQAKERINNPGPSWIELIFTSKVTQFLFWMLAVFFIGFIVYRLFISGGFFQSQTTRSSIKGAAEQDEIPVKDKNYDALVAAAKKEQNFRLATRYLYLQLLQRLMASGAIVFAADKTNSEYVRELTGKACKQEVAALTLNYEYVWYGEFAVDALLFAKLESRFKNISI